MTLKYYNKNFTIFYKFKIAKLTIKINNPVTHLISCGSDKSGFLNFHRALYVLIANIKLSLPPVVTLPTY